MFWKMNVIVALISVSSHPMYTVHAPNIWIWVEWEYVVRISPVKMTVKRQNIYCIQCFPSQKVRGTSDYVPLTVQSVCVWDMSTLSPTKWRQCLRPHNNYIANMGVWTSLFYVGSFALRANMRPTNQTACTGFRNACTAKVHWDARVLLMWN